MTTDEELRAAAEALGESVLVVGLGEAGTVAASRVDDRPVPAAADADRPDVAVLAVDGAGDVDAEAVAVLEEAEPAVAGASLAVAVVGLPSDPGADERDLLAALAERVDAVVLARDGGRRSAGDAGSGAESAEPGVGALTDAVATFVSVVREAGFVNLDLADARTVLEPVDRAALGVGEERTAAEAVGSAFASLPTGVVTDPADGVLVDLVGGPQMSVEDVSEAVSAVRGRVGPDAHVIWGGAVDPSLGEAVRVRLVLAGVDTARASPGDPCPRCEGSLSAYTLGGRTSLSCDDCGYAGVSVRLRGGQ